MPLEVLIGVAGLAIGGFAVWATMHAPHRPVKAKVEVLVTRAWPLFNYIPGELHASIQVINHGPTRAHITSVGLGIKGHGQMFGGDQMPGQVRLPAWLEPGSNLLYFIQADAIRQLADKLGVPTSDFTAYARLADGREVKAKNSIEL